MNKFLQSRHSKRTIAVLGLIAILVVLYISMNKKSKKPDFMPMTSVVHVDNVQVRDMPVVIETLAQTLAIDAADITSEINGIIGSIHFEEGQVVKRGDLLIKLEDAKQKAQLDQALAQEDLAEIDYNRLKSLVASSAAPKQELDKAEADLKIASANVALASAELEKTTIKAPFDGRLGVRDISLGQYVSIGDKLIHIVDKTKLKIQYSVPQQYLSKLELGAPVTFTTAAFPLEEFTGQVDFVSPSVDTSTRTILAEAIFENPHERLSPGLSGKITQVLSVISGAMTVPEEALMPTITGYEIFEVLDGHANSKAVQIGSRNAGRVHITYGVEVDDIIITQGQHNLRDGAAVEILDPEQG